MNTRTRPPDLLRDGRQEVVSLCVPAQRTVTPKFAVALAEAIIAPAIVLKLTPKVTSISSGLLAMSRSFSTTVLVAGSTLFRESSKVSLAFSILSSRPARTVPPVSGSSISTTMLLPMHENRKLLTICYTTDEEFELEILQGSEKVNLLL
jgi:hypothetical protein